MSFDWKGVDIMQQIKIFQSGEEHDVNQWLSENPDIQIFYINHIPMHDLGWDGYVLNQWSDIIIVYNR
jgi:hypothetical protein